MLSRDETVALAKALIEGERKGSSGPAVAIKRIAADTGSNTSTLEASRELKHIAHLLGAGTTQLVDNIYALEQDNYISFVDARAIVNGLTGPGGGDALLHDAISHAFISFRAAGDINALVIALKKFASQELQHQQLLNVIKKQQTNPQDGGPVEPERAVFVNTTRLHAMAKGSLTPFTSWPNNEDDDMSDETKTEAEDAQYDLSTISVLKVVQAIANDGLLSLANAASIRSGILEAPSGQFSRAVTCAVTDFITRGTDIGSLATALAIVCDVNGSIRPIARAPDSSTPTSHLAMKYDFREHGSPNPPLVARITDFRNIIKQLSSAGLVTETEAATVIAKFDKGDALSTNAFIDAITSYANGAGVDAITRCVKRLGRMHNKAISSEDTLFPKSSSVCAGSNTPDAAQIDAMQHLQLIAAFSGDGSLSSTSARALADNILLKPTGDIAAAVAQSYTQYRKVPDIKQLVVQLQRLGASAQCHRADSVDWGDCKEQDYASQIVGTPSKPGYLPQPVASVMKPDSLPITNLHFGMGVVASAADAGLLSLGDAALLLKQIESDTGSGQTTNKALRAFRGTGDIGKGMMFETPDICVVIRCAREFHVTVFITLCTLMLSQTFQGHLLLT